MFWDNFFAHHQEFSTVRSALAHVIQVWRQLDVYVVVVGSVVWLQPHHRTNHIDAF
jgi:hypothetical protein